MYIPIEPRIGVQPIALSSAAANHDLGTIIRARDPIYGEGEFIYLLGVVGTVIGSVVIWQGQSSGMPTYQTALAPATTYLDQPLAVAMSGNVAGQYGWYQIGGQSVMATNGVLTSPNKPVYLAGSGQVTGTASPGLEVLDAISITASGTPKIGQAVVEINRPFAQGQGVPSVGTARLPAAAASVSILSSDVEVGINTSSAPTTCPLPSVAAWAAANPNGLELTIFDATGNANTNAVSFTLNGTDTFLQGISPTIAISFGEVKLRPIIPSGGPPNSWFVRGIN